MKHETYGVSTKKLKMQGGDNDFFLVLDIL